MNPNLIIDEQSLHKLEAIEAFEAGGEAPPILAKRATPPVPYYIPKPAAGWRDKGSFTDAERLKLRPIAETLAMLDGNAFFTLGDSEHWWADQYLPEAAALYEANGGDGGWAGEASFVRQLGCIKSETT